MYTRCTIPKTHIPVHRAVGSTVALWCKRHFRTPPVWCCTVSGPRSSYKYIMYRSRGPVDVQDYSTVQRVASYTKMPFVPKASHGLVNWQLHLRNSTPSLQGAKGPPICVYTASGTCMGPRSRSCTLSRNYLARTSCRTLQELQERSFSLAFCRILAGSCKKFGKVSLFHLANFVAIFLQDSCNILQESCKMQEKRTFSCSSWKVLQDGFYWAALYRGCTEMPFMPECYPWPGELACASSESYT